ncbi:MAG: glycosyltransferase family 4 protein [Paraclostridium sordellii]
MILNINTYYFTSSMYKELEEQLEKNKINFRTYVPVTLNYRCRKECEGEINKYVIVSKCLNKYDKIWFSLKHKKILMDLETKIDFNSVDFVHAYSLFSNGYIALKLYKKYGKPYIVMVQNTDINVFFKYMIHLRKLGVEILENASKVIFFSETYKNFLIDNYIPNNRVCIEEKSIIIPSGIDKYWIVNKYNKKVDINKKVKLLYVGVVNKNKNVKTVIEVCKILIKKGIDIEYTIVGNIQDSKLYKTIKNTDFIKYIPYKDRKELINIYRDNDIFIMPSINESFGLVYLEAISQGIPVIYTRGQGFDRQFKEGEVGFSVNPFNLYEIVDCIEKIQANYETISNRCIEKIDEFKWENIYSKYCDLYNKLNNE